MSIPSSDLPKELRERMLRFNRIDEMFNEIDAPGCQVLVVPGPHLASIANFSTTLGYRICDATRVLSNDLNTDEAAQWLDIDHHSKFMIITPTQLPHWLMFLIYWAGEKGILNCTSGYGSQRQYRSLAGKSIVLVISEEKLASFESSAPDWLYRKTRSPGPVILARAVL